MDRAIRYVELSNDFVTRLLTANRSVERVEGRRFDRYKVNDRVTYFVDRNTWYIYGAKSALQYNDRRWYGTLETVMEFDWTTHEPIKGTPLYVKWLDREATIQASYKPRGRPKKVVTP